MTKKSKLGYDLSNSNNNERNNDMDREQLHNHGDLYGYIEHDEDARNPFDEFEPMGTLVTWHKRYDFGVNGAKEYGTPKDFLDEAKENGHVYLSVFLYDHSGLTVSTEPFSCIWDSGPIGFIYVTKEQLKSEYGDRSAPEAEEAAKKYMRGEIKTFDQYLTGDVWGVTIEKKTACKTCGDVTEEHLDSCWGFYGREYAEEECKRMFEDAKELAEEAA